MSLSRIVCVRVRVNGVCEGREAKAQMICEREIGTWKEEKSRLRGWGRKEMVCMIAGDDEGKGK